MSGPKHISAADAKARLAAVLDDVQHKGERYVVERHGREVAAIVTVADAESLEPPPSNGSAGALALLALWDDIPDEAIDDFLNHVHEERARDTGRSVELPE